MREKLILWDIDGTLMYSGGVAGDCMRAAMLRVYGRTSTEERRQYAGKTDRQIILETFPDQDPEALITQLDRFTSVYLEELEAARTTFQTRGQVLDGVADVLTRLADAPVVQSTLTGNLQPVAHWKLATMGLLPYIDLEAGAYGSDHHERARLPAIAAARAADRYGRAFLGQDVVVIGDTPNDIACGRTYGARTVAVASGSFRVEQLAEHQPDVLLPSLADTASVIAALLK